MHNNIDLLRRVGKVARTPRRLLPLCQSSVRGEPCPNQARIDCKTWMGCWGYFCARCWPLMAKDPGRLGTGIGQYLVLDEEEDSSLPDWVK